MNTMWKIKYCQVPKRLITLTAKVILIGGEGLRPEEMCHMKTSTATVVEQ